MRAAWQAEYGSRVVSTSITYRLLFTSEAQSGQLQKIQCVGVERTIRFQLLAPHAGVAGEARLAGEALLLKVGAGDRLLHWIRLPKLRAIQECLPGSRIELHNYPTRVVIDNVTNLTLDFGLVRIAEATSDLMRYKLPIQFAYALFVQEQLLPKDCNGKWVIEHAPLAIVAKYQNEVSKVAEEQRLKPNIRLLCSTFPQARRAVSSGDAAILPSTAFMASEVQGIRQFPLPFRIPEFENTESNLALVWSKRSEKLRPTFRQVIDALKKELCESSGTEPSPKPTAKGTVASATPVRHDVSISKVR